MNLFGSSVEVVFLTKNGRVIAYAWHHSKEKARSHLKKICEYHGLIGEVVESKALEGWLEEQLKNVVLDGEKFSLPDVEYRNKIVYEKLLEIQWGETATYSEIARQSGVQYVEMLGALMRNPLQILIPCHRLLTRKGTLMGFYPLGIEVKATLLQIEGAKWQKKSR